MNLLKELKTRLRRTGRRNKNTKTFSLGLLLSYLPWMHWLSAVCWRQQLGPTSPSLSLDSLGRAAAWLLPNILSTLVLSWAFELRGVRNGLVVPSVCVDMAPHWLLGSGGAAMGADTTSFIR